MSIIKHVTLQKIVAHDFRYDPRVCVCVCVYTHTHNLPTHPLGSITDHLFCILQWTYPYDGVTAGDEHTSKSLLFMPGAQPGMKGMFLHCEVR